MKCKSCGEVLDKITAFCPLCGAPMEAESGPSAVDELVKKLSEIDDEKSKYLLEAERKKNSVLGKVLRYKYESEDMDAAFEEKRINIIQSFPIPNTVEGIFEFMILASSNFDAEVYANNLDKRDISDAWLAKIEQAYKKADVMFGEHARFLKIKEIYDRVIREKDAAISAKTNKSKTGKLVGIVCGAIAAVAILIIVLLATRPIAVGKADEAFVGQQVSSAISYLEDKGFKNLNVSGTYTKLDGYDVGDIVSITVDGDGDFDADDKFNKKVRIEIVYVVKRITVSSGAKDLKGKNYEDVVALLRQMGFTNISVVEKKDVTLGWFNSVGDVKSVQINGDDDFDAGDSFSSDATLIVTYHGQK